MSRYLQLKFPTERQYQELSKLVEKTDELIKQYVDIDKARRELLYQINNVANEYSNALKHACPKAGNVISGLLKVIKANFPKIVQDALFTVGAYDRPHRLYTASGLRSLLITGVFAAIVLDRVLYLRTIEAYTYYVVYHMLTNLVPYCDETVAMATLQNLGKQSDLGKFKSFYIVARNKYTLYRPRIEYLFDQQERVILAYLVATLFDYIKANSKAALMPFVRKYYELKKHPELLEKRVKTMTISPRIFPTILAKFITLLDLQRKTSEGKDACVLDYLVQHSEDTKKIFTDILAFVSYEVDVDPCNPAWPAEVRRRFRNPKLQKILADFDSMVRTALFKCGYEKEAQLVQQYSTYRAHYRTLVFSLFFKAVFEVLCTHKAIGNLLQAMVKQLKLLWRSEK